MNGTPLIRTASFSTLVLTAPMLSCAKGLVTVEPGHGQSILDRVEHIEPALVTPIPEAFRWCDRLPWLDKRRIDSGGAELYGVYDEDPDGFFRVLRNFLAGLEPVDTAALSRYRKAAEMGLADTQMHAQYGLKYSLSPDARERLEMPFKRLENNMLY